MSLMKTVTLDKVVSFTEARNNLSSLIETLSKEGYLVVTKRLEPSVVLVSPKLFGDLEQAKKRIEMQEDFDRAVKPLRLGFLKYLRKRGLDPERLTAEEAMGIIQKDAEA